jgi:hypothetical protein
MCGMAESVIKKPYSQNNNTGISVNLSSYTSSSNKYTFPNDGYVSISSETVSSGNIRVVILGANDDTLARMYMNITDAYQIQSLFVRKGTKVFLANQSNGTTAYYYPLID